MVTEIKHFLPSILSNRRYPRDPRWQLAIQGATPAADLSIDFPRGLGNQGGTWWNF